MRHAHRAPFAMPEFLIGLGLLVIAGAALWQTLSIPVTPMYAKVGPTVFPYITVFGLTLLAIFLIAQALRGGWQPDEEKEVALDWRAFGFVVAGLVANAALIQPIGFTAASTIMFVLITHGS